ncbi:MAG: ubiquitin-protein ligase peroxin 12 [Cyphobasidiales sp. Tagirdzhanova-0007]|nr:MAG: ubiquitin-protein ligase peroxin 12 [Cyphobasidiales sp. Tagirdzhanova-0007]
MEVLSDVSGGDDRYRPSFFELAAQGAKKHIDTEIPGECRYSKCPADQLRDLLQPVFRYLLSVLATRYPRYALRFSNRHEETYASITFLIERHYLSQWNGSFSENFYGMKRRRRPGVSSERAQAAVDIFTDHEKLRKREIRWSLFFLIAIPYIRSKAEDLYEQSGGDSSEHEFFEDNLPGESLEGQATHMSRFERLQRTLKAVFLFVWPRISTSYEVLLLAYNIGYLFDKTPYHRPWMHWLGIDLRRMSEQDYIKRKANAAQASLLGYPFQLALEALKYVLPTSIFFFKFLEWWYSSSYARSRLSAKSESKIPALRPPPRSLLPHPEGVLGSEGQKVLPLGTCPICRKQTTNPTALPTGWVGDYRCLYDYVAKEGLCPVTRMKVTVGDLRKING